MIDKQLDHLISMLYRGTINPNIWREALSLCGQYVEATNGVFLTVSKQDNNLPVCVLQETGFASHTEKISENQSIDIYRLLNMFPDTTTHEWRYSLHNQNFIDHSKPYQKASSYSTHHLMAVWMNDNKENKYGLLVLARADCQRPFSHDDRLLAQRFSSHFLKAFRMQNKLQFLSTLSGRVIDALASPMLIVDNQGYVIHLNFSAKRSLYSLILNSEGHLSCVNPAKNHKLTALISNATHNRVNGGMFLDSDGIEQIFVSPLPDMLSQDCKTSTPLALIVIVKVDISNSVSTLQLLGKLYHLTPAELRLASALLQGKSPDDHARAEGVTVHTARSHLKMLLRKTNTRKQSELVGLLSKAPALYDL